MSVGRITLELWHRSARWRLIVVGATVFTVLAFFSGKPSTQGPAIPGIPAPSGASGLSAAPTFGQNAASQQCGPQGQLALQAPIVVSSTGQAPQNAQVTAAAPSASSGIPPLVLSRFRLFATQVDAANLEQRLGERCVRMNGALDVLEASDFAYADCFQDGEKKLVAAQSCSDDLIASETRFERLLAAYSASESDGSASRIEELARARGRMLPFDETRERWGLSDTAVAAGNAAIEVIAASDQRIAGLDAVSTVDASTVEGLTRLAGAAELTAFDRSRLMPQAYDNLERAEAAKARLMESDRRLSAVGDAIRGETSADAARRAGLISALSAITELDIARADDVQKVFLEKARAMAAQYALGDLIAASGTIDILTASPEELQRIRDLALAARRYSDAAEQDPRAGPAYLLADQATGLLAQSDQRLFEMREVVGRIEAGGPAALGSDVLVVFDAISEFDRARMSVDDVAAYARLSEARDITLASREGVLTRSVPIHLRSAADDDLSRLAMTELQRALEGQGFTLVDALERAAIEVSLSLSDIDQKTVKLANTSITTAEVRLSLLARWTVADAPIAVPAVEGSAAGSDILSLSREAVSKAASAAAAEIANLARP